MTRDILSHAFGAAIMCVLLAWFGLYILGVVQ